MPMTHDTHQKVNSIHLKRTAYLYIRQSTLRQVFENTESTKRQYGLRQKAIALGWPADRIVVIDSDLGQSGASAADSTTATVKLFRKQGLLFSRRVHGGPQRGELVWAALGHCQVLRILHNPRYAGAFVFGRHHSRKTVDGHCRIVAVPQEEWQALIPGAQAGYVSWEDYQHNQQRLHESAQAMGGDRRRSPVREGPAR
jgi:hypothetical protein